MTITIDPDVIAGRALLIQEDAPCVGCGSSRSACEESRKRRDDPTAPEWFGCCAMGTGLAPCRHEPRAADSAALLREIQSGHVRPAEEIRAERKAIRERDAGKPVSIRVRFDQGEWWRTKDGTWLRIADMEPSHRGNTARMLLRGAAGHAFRYGMADALEVSAGPWEVPEEVQVDMERNNDERLADPAGWLRSTKLFKALTARLTGDDARMPDPLPPVCQIPACGCSGKAHA